MELKEVLETATYIIAIGAGLCGGCLFLWRAYSNAIERQRQLLIKSWTNEGLVFGESDEKLMTLSLTEHAGELIGELNANSLEYPLEANVQPGWPWARVEISRFNRSSVTPICTAKVRIKGNNNRLVWRIVKGSCQDIPNSTVLWLCANA